MEEKTSLPNPPASSQTVVVPPINPPPLNKTVLIILLVVSLVILSSLITYLLVKVQVPPQMSVVSPASIVQTSPTPSANNITTNWTTHSNRKLGFEYKYPEPDTTKPETIDCTIPRANLENIDCLKVGKFIYIYVDNKSFSECIGQCPIYTKTEKLLVGTVEFTKYNGTESNGEATFEVIDLETKLKNGNYLRFLLTDPFGIPSQSDQKGLELRAGIRKTFDQILSTFKFN